MDQENKQPTPQEPNTEEPLRPNNLTDEEWKEESEFLNSVFGDEATESATAKAPPPPKKERRFTWRQLAVAVCATLVTAILLTYTLTSAWMRKAYVEKLLEQQEVIQELQGDTSPASNLRILEQVIQAYSLYADALDGKAMLEAAFEAYVHASGDRYAEYYTAEEYLEMVRDNNAELCGIGIDVRSETVTVNGTAWAVYRVTNLYDGSSAHTADLRVGDLIYGVTVDGEMKTVNELGYNGAGAAIRGEENTTVTVGIYRKNGETYENMTRELIRRRFETLSVEGFTAQADPQVGIVRISSFDLKTPTQFKQVMTDLMAKNVSHFVFDLRNNPGGDLQSIKAVLTYFLQKGDLILESVNNRGQVVTSYVAEAMTHEGDYAACNVTESEIGMYSGLSMAVLCNGSTASAAEVFTATMQDYGLARVVGTQTYGKGVMQSTKAIPFSGEIVGYIKLTTHAYHTKRGAEQSYHGIGITPDVPAELSEEAKKYALKLLPQYLDAQLNAAIATLKTANQ